MKATTQLTAQEFAVEIELISLEMQRGSTMGVDELAARLHMTPEHLLGWFAFAATGEPHTVIDRHARTLN